MYKIAKSFAQETIAEQRCRDDGNPPQAEPLREEAIHQLLHYFRRRL